MPYTVLKWKGASTGKWIRTSHLLLENLTIEQFVYVEQVIEQVWTLAAAVNVVREAAVESDNFEPVIQADEQYMTDNEIVGIPDHVFTARVTSLS